MKQSEVVERLSVQIVEALLEANIVDVTDQAHPSDFLASSVVALALAIATHNQDWEAIDD